MDLSDLPITSAEWAKTLRSGKTSVLILSSRRPKFSEKGKTARMERYFSRLFERLKQCWEGSLYTSACAAFAACAESGEAFTPWECKLDYEITYWSTPLVSMRLNIYLSRSDAHPIQICMGETWDCSTGYPRTLRSFFPAHSPRWKKQLLDGLKEQATQQLSAGESLLDPDCVQIMERTFDPERFYLTEQGVSIFYPLYILGPYAEGIPVFTLPFPENTFTQTDCAQSPSQPCDDTW